MTGNILIVDDSVPALKLLRDLLLTRGYVTRPFSDAAMALRSIAEQPPELILLDVRMPVLSGFDLCTRIKADARLRDIPVIFISAATETEDKVRAFEAGGVDYITKPFQNEEVLARVQTHLALHQSRQQLIEAERALRKSEQSLKIAQAVAHLGHWSMDSRSGHVTWSDEIYRIFGLEPQTTVPSYEAFLQAAHPDDRAHLAACIENTLKGADFDIEYRILLPDGRTRMAHAKGVLVSFTDPDRPHEVIGTVQHIPEMIGVIQDITERKQLEWRLELEARTDALTGCANRRYFLDLAQQEFSRMHRFGGSLSALMLDLDQFKSINDVHGHAVGDLTLQKFTQVCRSILREQDLVGRLGGEEFAIVLVETGEEQAREIAERLRESVAAAEIPLAASPPLNFTTSIGLATATAADADFAAVLKRADQALYEAKKAGRNRVCVHSSPVSAETAADAAR